jgi:plasmid stabilization system protein ParE
MKIEWSDDALSDLRRFNEFLARVNPSAAAKAIQSLTSAPDRLIRHPRLGERIERYAPREIRRIIVGRYEIRYEVIGSVINILRIWHTHEDR